ncbi:MAG: multidrug efflux MFS transporter [Lentisphaerae bacterium]|nr:multidrug efflux MFS transporter [Lentisphaerota bacterium]
MKKISWKRNLACIWIGQLLAMAGTSMVLPFIPLFLREKLGIAAEAQRAMAVSMFYSVGMFSFCLSNPIWGALGDRYGRKLMLLRAYFFTALTFPAMYFMPTWGSLIVMRFFASMFSGTVAAAQALVAVTTPDKHQGFALGTLSTAFWSGNMLGMVAGGVVVHYCGYMSAFLACGGAFLIAGIMTLLLVEENFVPPLKKLAVKNGARRWKLALPDFSFGVWVLLGLFFILPLARRCDEPFLALLVELISGEEKAALNTGWVTALAAAGGILSGVFFGYMSDRCKPLQLAIPALAAAGVFMIIQSTAQSLLVLGMTRFLVFFAAGGLEPIFLAMLSQTVDPAKRGSAFGWTASSRVFGGMFGALIGGAVIAWLGTRGVFAFGGILMLLLIPILIGAFKLIKRSKRS